MEKRNNGKKNVINRKQEGRGNWESFNIVGMVNQWESNGRWNVCEYR